MQLVKSFLSISGETRSIAKHIGLSSLYKGGSILIAFLLVPLSISYLGNEKYGLWLTIYSFIGWFNFFDFGIGHGLRNKLTEAWATKNINLAKTYISTAYFSIVLVITIMIILFVVLFPFIPWENIFKSDDTSIRKIILIAYIIFITNLVLSLVSVVFLADQKSSLPGLIQFIGQIIVLVCIYLAMNLKSESLLLYVGIVMASQSLVFLLATIIAFSGKYTSVRPDIKFFDKNNLRDLIHVGGSFFFIQIAGTLLFTTDNFIINYYFGAKDVTVYNIAFKYFMIPIVAINIIASPYWSAFTDAHFKNNDKWIKKSLFTLMKIATAAVFFTIVMIFFADKFYLFWVGTSVSVPRLLTLLIGINTILLILLEPLIMLINGIGKLKIQLYTALISAFINIPLSIFLSVHLNYGISGVVLSSLICTVGGVLIYPIQVKKILNKTASGIWNS